MAISFRHDRPWGGVSQREYRRMAQHPGHPLAYRVHFAAIGWADRQGHAGFEPGRPAALLGKSGKPLSDQSTRNAVARAKEPEQCSGLVDRLPGSTRRAYLPG
ncbi:hypothetical protein WBG99_28560 [Streptomyces sp. TG1A-60]|uniref:hypothetical protein n=1 Tax=Streptomyces sp. TG1A-60 TaxID=3129111 RepID=UPI0030CBC498